MAFAGLIANIAAHGFGRLSYSIILPEMAEALGLNWTMAGLLGTANMTGYLLFAIGGGFLAPRYGTRKVITCSLLIIAITLMLTGVTTSFTFAMAMRFLTGIANGGVYIPAMALGALWFSSRRRGMATGIVGGGPGMGIFFTGLIIPPVLLAGGWSSSWKVMGWIVLGIWALCFVLLRDHPQEKTKTNPASQPDGEKWSSVYRRREIWSLGLVYVTYGFSYAVYATFFHAFLTTEETLPAAQSAAMWSLAGGMSIFASILWGSVSDFLGRKYTMSIVYLINAVSYSLFFFSRNTSLYYLSVILFGLGLGSIPTIVAATAGDYVGPRLASAAMGFLTAFFGVGQLLGPALGGIITDTTGSFRLAFAAAGFVALLGAAGSLLLKKPNPSSN